MFSPQAMLVYPPNKYGLFLMIVTEGCMPAVHGFFISYVLTEKCYKFWTHEKVFISRQKLYENISEA